MTGMVRSLFRGGNSLSSGLLHALRGGLHGGQAFVASQWFQPVSRPFCAKRIARGPLLTSGAMRPPAGGAFFIPDQ
jgi:hypothetical protein